MTQPEDELSKALRFLLNWKGDTPMTYPVQANCDVCGRLAYLKKKEIPGGRHRDVCGGCAPGVDQEIEDGQYDDEE